MARKRPDRTAMHSWINWPNKGRKKCLSCGCICTITTCNYKHVSSYELDGIVSTEYIPCKSKL